MVDFAYVHSCVPLRRFPSTSCCRNTAESGRILLIIKQVSPLVDFFTRALLCSTGEISFYFLSQKTAMEKMNTAESDGIHPNSCPQWRTSCHKFFFCLSLWYWGDFLLLPIPETQDVMEALSLPKQASPLDDFLAYVLALGKEVELNWDRLSWK